MNRLIRLFRRISPATAASHSQFDPDACIRCLLDKAENTGNRGAAAESLGYGSLGPSESRAVDALFEVARDERDSMDIREEAAAALGEIWARIGVDRERYDRLPADVRREAWEAMLGSGSADGLTP